MLLGETASQDALLSSKAYVRLKDMILRNELTVGVYYLERELSDLLGVSRTPLKEALVRLEREGLIQVRPRHGMKVLPISADDMAEIYQITTALECEAVYALAARGLSDTEINALEDTTKRMEAALEQGTLEGWAVADEAFHRLLLDLCPNKRLKETVLMFWDQSHRARYLTLGFREKPINSTEDHRQVVNAIKERNPIEAAAIHRRHRVNGGATIVAILRKLPMGGS